MIQIKDAYKSFGKIEAVNKVSLDIEEGLVFGLLGTNGAGKSTLLRMMSGVLKTDGGEILVDGEPIWNNPEAKGKLFYISDDQYYFSNSTPKDLAEFYKKYYPEFDVKRYMEFLHRFQLDPHRKVRTFSKGMKKQLSILIGICTGTKYLLCDETFDGLDPVMRQGIKSIFANEIDERKVTLIIASHNLRELEDICDHIGLLHKGGVLLSKDMEALKCNIFKIQCVLPEECDEELKARLSVVKYERRGKLISMTVRGKEEEIVPVIQSMNPVYWESLPLSLEEIFISETEVVGYDIKNLIF